MKNIVLYLFSIILITITVYYVKNSYSIQSNQIDTTTELRHSDYIRAEI